MTRQVNLYEAKTQLSQLVEDAARGEEIVIAKNGKPMAKLTVVTTEEQPKKRALGQWAKLMTPEELAYHRSEQFERDWKEWDREIAHDFNRGLEEDWKEYDGKWGDTSSTPTSTSRQRKPRSISARKRSQR